LPSAGDPTKRLGGHGRRLVQAVYEYVISDATVFEITVEEPCPEFVTLRDMIDLRNCHAKQVFQNPATFNQENKPGSNMLGTKNAASSLLQFEHGRVAEKKVEEIRKLLKITQQQIQFAYEMLRMLELISRSSSSSSSLGNSLDFSANEDDPKTKAEWTRLRLDIKRRLRQEFAEYLDALPDKADVKTQLGQFYQEAKTHYLSVIQRSKLTSISTSTK